MAKVFLGLGTNLGDKRNNLLTAVTNIEEKIGKVTSLSSFYETYLLFMKPNHGDSNLRIHS